MTHQQITAAQQEAGMQPRDHGPGFHQLVPAAVQGDVQAHNKMQAQPQIQPQVQQLASVSNNLAVVVVHLTVMNIMLTLLVLVVNEHSSQSGSCAAQSDGSGNVSPDAVGLGHGPDLDGSSSSAKGGHPPVPTSRISVKHAVSVIHTFDEYKMWLVDQIGFGGMLKLPDLQKLNLKCSAWIMSRVSVNRREIQLREHKIFLLDNLDLGIFNKPHNVLPRISVFDGIR
ncbi:hypothetical protein D1007_33747 [Hordeum vulgare]|nr:hypothetical protein D1007_33747 [Hordeum vulgare]